ncbi:MAG: M1 family metallopeptidase [Anaerolineae bacterium]|nr:M1 family metallopeptidase [Anaerolineae bacterium]
MVNYLNRLCYSFALPGLLFAACLLPACALSPSSALVDLGLITPTPTPDPFLHYRAALQPGAQGDIETAGPLPRYHVSAQLNPDGTALHGVARLDLSPPGPELVFRLYPNLANYGGKMRVTAAQVNDTPVKTMSLANDTALRLAIPPSAGNTRPTLVTVKLAFETELNSQPHLDSSDYTLFGWDGPVLSLPGFYPTLAVPQGQEWALDQPPAHGDVLFNEAALYQVDLTLPRELVVAAGGVTLNLIDHPGENTRTWQIAGGPLRDLTLIAGPFQAISEEAAGATVTSYYLPGHAAAGQAVLAHAAASLRLYSDTYGPYPYTELDVVEAPLNVRGMEYSGLILIGEDLYQEQREYLTFLVAHEVGHQWWYAVVGNNPYRHPWLDEGLTEYGAFDYYRGVFGQAEAEQLLTGRWQIPFAVAAGGGVDGAVDRPAGDFDPTSYELLVYAKAALFFNALREQLGEETYRQVLQTYYAENRYRLATPQIFLATAERVSGQNLNPLAEEWLK